jgi:hypothetical protein
MLAPSCANHWVGIGRQTDVARDIPRSPVHRAANGEDPVAPCSGSKLIVEEPQSAKGLVRLQQGQCSPAIR